MEHQNRDKIERWVVQWKKPAGWYEEDFDTYQSAYEHFLFESDNPVVSEVLLVERLDTVQARYKYGADSSIC